MSLLEPRGVAACALFAVVSLALPPRPAECAEPRLDLARIQSLPGREIGRGTNAEPATHLRLLSFLLEELSLPSPVLARVDGRRVEVEVAYRLTLTGKGFPVRDMPAVLLIDDEPVAVGAESADLQSLVFVIFNRRLLRHGASLAVTYGGDTLIDARDPDLVAGDLALPALEGAQVFALPESLNLDKE